MGKGPRFMYILTIQNHGGYGYLNENDYLVHTQNDFGDYTNDINEFATCMYLSNKGFEELKDFIADFAQ